MFQTLARSLRPRDTLKLSCVGCGHRTAWTLEEACRHCGPDATPSDVRRRLVCRGCGARGQVLLRI